MSPFLLTSKISVPHLPPGYTPRPRLDDLWKKWDKRKLWVVTAGAGYGKSSFLAAHAHANTDKTVWYAADEVDQDVTVFCAHLNEALHLDAGKTAKDSTDPQTQGQMLARIVHALQDRPDETLLVFDDLHLLREAGQTQRFLERLIQHLPGHCRVVLASREPIEMVAGRHGAQSKLARITAKDLAFQEKELRSLFLRRFPGRQLPTPITQRIIHSTEGWAAGIEIFLQALVGTSPEEIGEALDELIAQGLGWFDYFAEEVLRRLDEKTRDFLLRSAVLPRIEPRLCNRILQIRNSRARLSALCKRNMFTFSLSGPEQQYRYHHLFREFLLSRQETHLSSTELQTLRRRAAKGLIESGAWAEAAACLAEAGDNKATLQLIEKQGEKLLATGRNQVVQKALDAIPRRMRAQSPTALLLQGRILDIHGQWDEAEGVYRRALRICKRKGRQAELKSLIAQLLLKRGEYQACINLCRRALADKGTRTTAVGGALYAHLGVALGELGRLEDGELHLQRAIETYRKNDDLDGEGWALYLLAANIYYRRGSYQQVKDAARKSLLISKRTKNPGRLSLSLGVLGFVAATTGAVREAEELTMRALRIAHGLDYQIIVGYCRHTLGLSAMVEKDFARAQENFESARQTGEQLGEATLRTLPRLGQSEIDWCTGRFKRAHESCQQIVKTLRGTGDLLGEARARVLLGQMLWDGEPKRAQYQWNQAEKSLRAMGALFDLHRLLLLRLWAGSYPQRTAGEKLRELIEGTAQHRHDFLFTILEREAAPAVLGMALREGVEPTFCAGLLVQFGSPAIPVLSELAQESGAVRGRVVDILSQLGGSEAREVLGKLASPLRGEPDQAAQQAAQELLRQPGTPLVVRGLGPLEIQVGELQLGHAAWRSARARRLLQLLLIHQFRWVPRDVVLEALWPDADPEKSANSLWQTMHVLGRLLEPDLQEARLSAYVRVRDEACRLMPGEDYTYDVEQFESAVKEAEKAWPKRKSADVETPLRRAAELYRGDLFVENPYEEFATAERERLREMLLRALGRLLQLHTERSNWEEVVFTSRRALEIDAYQEELHWFRVQAHLRLGHRREALDAYHQYEEMLVREMGLLPSDRMRALADQVVSLRSAQG